MVKEVVTVAADDNSLIDAHARFFGDAIIDPGVRPSVLASWRRCRFHGLRPDALDVDYSDDLDWEGDLVRTARPVLEKIESELSGIPLSTLLCDARARVLRRHVEDSSLISRLDTLNVAPGFGFAEEFVGTNGIGTALAERRSTYIYGAEHFAEPMRVLACAAMPIRDPLSGRIEGVIDVTSLCRDAHPSMLTAVREAVAGIESLLLERITERERILLRTFNRVKNQTSPPPAGEDPLSRYDQLVLQEKAAEMISQGQAAILDVTLSGGERAILLSRPLSGPSGTSGIAVEAVLPGRHPLHLNLSADRTDGELNLSTDRTGGERPASGPPGEPPAHRPRPSVRLTRPPEPHLVAVGEPGIVRLAVAARRRLEFLYEAGVRIGTTLDVKRTAEELARVVVPRFADHVAVDLPDSVTRGEEPTDVHIGLRRIAVGSVRGDTPLYRVGEAVTYAAASPQARCLAVEQSVLVQDLSTAVGWQSTDPERSERILEAGIHSLITVPLCARGVMLGVVSFYRSRPHPPFEDDDLSVAEELAARAAVCIDNARRYTREHTTTLTLQRSMLPRALPEQNAVDVAYCYRPAQSTVGGDWFDVIPLSGTRVAMVVGDVVGHGLHASATMGRLRTAVQTFSALDLPADEVLARLDDLVCRLDSDEGGDNGFVGATCLYAVYDPITRHCTIASAGHPTPALQHPGGAIEFLDVPIGPPLGLGGLPFEAVDLDLAEGSRLVLFTDGLIEQRDRDLDVGLERMRQILAEGPDRTPQQICQVLLEGLLPERPDDDVAVLVAQTRGIGPDQVGHWDLPADPSVVSQVRASVTRLLAEWGMEELAMTTELIVSELVTNAIRYAAPPLQLRLIRDRALICEVSDNSSTSPRLRRAASTDEGGRGLFLVAQLARRWGTRYTRTGKVIWTEQPIPH